MKIKSSRIILLAAVAALAACKNEPVPTYTVGADDNAIVLAAGIADGGADVSDAPSRAPIHRTGIEDHHGSHLPFASGTKAALRIDGTWTGHTPSEAITLTTTATIGTIAAGTDGKHNTLTMSPQLYWDDYGTADPANMPPVVGNGRDKGLTIYGAAVNGVTTAPVIDGTTGKQWTALSWELAADQSAGWSEKDLLTSNNIKGDGNRYTFANAKAEPVTNNLLEFTHAMSKVTVRLIADEGFPTTGVGATTKKFAALPEVKLTSNHAGGSDPEWAYTAGNVDITTGVVSGITSPAIVTMHEADHTNTDYTATYDALIMPGSTFSADDATIARIQADGNVYYITAKEIRTKMHALLSTTDYKTESGKNYVLTARLKKTGIDVTATILNWVDVESAEVLPVIDVNTSYGGTGTFDKDNFSYYRSLLPNTDYSKDYSGNANGYFAAEATVTKPTAPATKWDFSTPLFWPDHNTHYQMRGVWPLTGTETGDVAYPRVEVATHDAIEYQVIKVENVAYTQNTFPSDLAIGRPNVDEEAECTNAEPGHTKTNLYSGGICATEGTINLEFNYMMSQVEVHLSTTDPEATDHVELAGAVVEITNLYTTGDIKLGDRGCIPTGSTGAYTMHVMSGTGNENNRHDAIVPQDLTYTTAGAETNVRFKITITNANGTQDIYFADVAPIFKTGTTEKIAPNGKWESGQHYVYNLKIAKSQIEVTATFKDWITVTAEEDIWF